ATKSPPAPAPPTPASPLASRAWPKNRSSGFAIGWISRCPHPRNCSSSSGRPTPLPSFPRRPPMLAEYQQLVDEIRDLTGASAPALMEIDAPVLADDALNAAGDQMYLVAIIGGKDVGKSALVNALVGQEITARTSFGPGTEIAVA